MKHQQNPADWISNPKIGNIQLEISEMPRGKGNALPGKVIFGYRRCREYDDRNGEGQDYARLHSDTDRVVGVLADGVSQSFFGQIAARRVVEGLMDHLFGDGPFDAVKLSQGSLIDALHAIAQEGADEVTHYSLRDDLSPTMRDLLEADRRKGSQTVFGVFAYERATRSLTVCQLGDVRIQVFADGHDPFMVPADKMGRFSIPTRSASKIAENLHIEHYENVLGVLMHSDGVDDKWGEKPSALEIEQRGTLEAAMEQWARQDDVSIVGVLTEPLVGWAAKNPLPTISKKPVSNPLITTPELEGVSERRSTADTPVVKARTTQTDWAAPTPVSPNAPAMEQHTAKNSARPPRGALIASGVLVLMIVSFVAGKALTDNAETASATNTAPEKKKPAKPVPGAKDATPVPGPAPAKKDAPDKAIDFKERSEKLIAKINALKLGGNSSLEQKKKDEIIQETKNLLNDMNFEIRMHSKHL
jgi:hypothetical protein